MDSSFKMDSYCILISCYKIKHFKNDSSTGASCNTHFLYILKRVAVLGYYFDKSSHKIINNIYEIKMGFF